MFSCLRRLELLFGLRELSEGFEQGFLGVVAVINVQVQAFADLGNATAHVLVEACLDDVAVLVGERPVVEGYRGTLRGAYA